MGPAKQGQIMSRPVADPCTQATKLAIIQGCDGYLRLRWGQGDAKMAYAVPGRVERDPARLVHPNEWGMGAERHPQDFAKLSWAPLAQAEGCTASSSMA
jgi:hypothetical protein